jgi:hypothetical protein
MGNDTKNLSTIINQIRTQSPDIAIMLFSVDHTTDKFVCLANVSDVCKLKTKDYLFIYLFRNKLSFRFK